jgi:hypothetical protein
MNLFESALATAVKTNNQYAILDRQKAQELEEISNSELSELFPIVINWKDDYVDLNLPSSFQKVIIRVEDGFNELQENVLNHFDALLFEDFEQVSNYIRQKK